MRIADLLAGMIVGAGITGVVALATRWLCFTGDFVLGLTTGLISSAVVVVVLGIVRALTLYWKWETSQTPTTLTAGSGSSMCESRIPDFSSGAGSCDARRQPAEPN